MKVSTKVTYEGTSKSSLLIEIMGENKVVIARVRVANLYPYEYNMDVFPVAYWEKSLVQELPYSSVKLNLDVKGHGYKLARTISNEYARRVQNFGEQHPDFHSPQMKKWRKAESKRAKEKCYCSDDEMSIPHYH